MLSIVYILLVRLLFGTRLKGTSMALFVCTVFMAIEKDRDRDKKAQTA